MNSIVVVVTVAVLIGVNTTHSIFILMYVQDALLSSHRNQQRITMAVVRDTRDVL